MILSHGGNSVLSSGYKTIYYTDYSNLDLATGIDIPQVGDTVSNYPTNGMLNKETIDGKLFLMMKSSRTTPYDYGPSIIVS